MVDSDDKEVALRFGADGVEARAPLGLLDRLLPKWAGKAIITAGAAKAISEKLARQEPLNDLDQFFCATIFDRELKRYDRQIEIRNRMGQLAAHEPNALPPASEAHVLTEAQDDFVERFWEDAERITDAHIRDLYARVGLWEDRKPGSFSLQTLSVLRDLDRAAKASFERVCRPFLLTGLHIVDFGFASKVYKTYGIEWSDILRLVDARLIAPPQNSRPGFIFGPHETTDTFDFGTFDLKVHRHKALAQPQRISVPSHYLTKAGVELAQLLPREDPPEEYVWIVSALLRGEDPYGVSNTGTPVELDIAWRRKGEEDFEPVDMEFGARFCEVRARHLAKRAASTVSPGPLQES